MTCILDKIEDAVLPYERLLIGGFSFVASAIGGFIILLVLSNFSYPWNPNCDTRQIKIGMTRNEVLATCPGPDYEFDRAAETSKSFNMSEYFIPAHHWMAWRFGSDDSDTVRLTNGEVDYTESDRFNEKDK